MPSLFARYSASPATVTTDQQVPVLSDAQGRLVVTVSGGTSTANGVYNITPPTLVDGASNAVQLDVNGNLKTREQYAAVAEDNTNGVIAGVEKPLATNTYAPTLATSLGAAATANVKATAGNVLSLYAYNTNAAARFVQLHNTATTPGGGAVPIYTFLVPATGAVLIDHQFFVNSGAYFGTGIAFGFSTTAGTYTAATAAESFIHVHYK